MQYETTLAAGQRNRQEIAGTYFAILDMGASTGLDVQFWQGNELLEEVRGVTQRFKARAAVAFDRITLLSSNATTVKYVISQGALDIEGANVNATIVGTPTVDTVRGSPGNLMYVSGISIADAPATSATTAAGIACGPVAAVVAAANANRRAMRLRNLGPDPVAIGPAGLTWAQRVIVLDVDDVWIEDRGANLAWSAITDTAKTATVTVQGVLA